MNPGFIQSLFSEKVVTAFCWTMIHSIWQGMMIAIIASIIILITRQSKAAVRYKGLLSLFCLFLVVVSFTFLYQINNGSFIKAHIFLSGYQHYGNLTIRNIFIKYINEHTNMLVLMWLVIALIKCIKMAADLWYLKRLRTREISTVPAYWYNRIIELSYSLGINQRVQLLQSHIIKVPSVVGFVKPIILVPFGFFAHLSMVQIEAILLHELAHIKRQDYVINLLQSFVEILFFFNPPVLWLAYRIKAEREYCCDDIALDHAGSKRKYIEALIRFQECKFPVEAISFRGITSCLYNRIIRIAINKNKMFSTSEFAFLIITPFFIFLMAVMFGTTITSRSLNKLSTGTAKTTIKEIAVPGRQVFTFQMDTQSAKNTEVGKEVVKSNRENKGNVSLGTQTIDKRKTDVNRTGVVLSISMPTLEIDRQKSEVNGSLKNHPLEVESTFSFPEIENNKRSIRNGFPASPEEHRREAAAVQLLSDEAKEQSYKMKEEHYKIKIRRGNIITI